MCILYVLPGCRCCDEQTKLRIFCFYFSTSIIRDCLSTRRKLFHCWCVDAENCLVPMTFIMHTIVDKYRANKRTCVRIYRKQQLNCCLPCANVSILPESTTHIMPSESMAMPCTNCNAEQLPISFISHDGYGSISGSVRPLLLGAITQPSVAGTPGCIRGSVK